MDFLESELQFKFQKKFGGSFYFMIPDNIFVYDNDEKIYIVDEKKVSEMAEQSLKVGQNLLLSGEVLNFDNEEVI